MRPFRKSRDPRVVIALALAVVGCADLILGMLAPRSAPTIFWPFVMLGRPIAAVVCGLILLYLAKGLARGLRAAWTVTLFALSQVVLLAPVNHDEWALTALIPLAMLWVFRANFEAASRAPIRGGAAIAAGSAVLWLARSAFHSGMGLPAHVIGFAQVVRAADGDDRLASLRHVLPRHPAFWSVLPLIGVGVLIILDGLRGLTLPRQPRSQGGDHSAMGTAVRLFEAHGANAVDYFSTLPGRAIWTDPDGRGVVAFRLIGATALVVGDPVAPKDAMQDVLKRFLDHCRSHGWTPAFYQTLESTLPIYRVHGLQAMAIGREAIIDLLSFTLDGKRLANVRHSVTHAERAGIIVRLLAGDDLDDDARHDIMSISEEWLAGKGGSELGFTMGQVTRDGHTTPGARVALAYDGANRAQAFITVVPAGGGRGWMLDLMRRRGDAASGTMDLLIARTALALRDEGYGMFSLSLAPMAAGAADDEDAPGIARRGRTLLYDKMGGAYSYRSLFNFKKKFGVRWETRYLMYDGDAALPGSLCAVVRAHLPATLVPLPSFVNQHFASRSSRDSTQWAVRTA